MRSGLARFFLAVVTTASLLGDDGVDSIQKEHPTLVDVALDAGNVAETLFANGNESEILVAAELLESIGQNAAARKAWVQVARHAKSEDARYRALHALGMHYFLRRRYADCWNNYWGTFQSLGPDSPWAKRTARWAPFLELASALDLAIPKEGPVIRNLLPRAPEFRGNFVGGEGDDPGEKRGKDLLGGWVLLDFWSSTPPRAHAHIEALASTVARARNRGWEGLVLGVNLDADRETFEKALADWEITWPQHHDGLVFESPFVRAFAIPKAPMSVLIDPTGRVTHVSRNGAKLADALGRARRESAPEATSDDGR